MIHWMTTSATTSDNEWQQVTTNDNEKYNGWQRVVQRVNNLSFFFRIREEPTTKHPKENSLSLEVDLEEGLLN